MEGGVFPTTTATIAFAKAHTMGPIASFHVSNKSLMQVTQHPFLRIVSIRFTLFSTTRLLSKILTAMLVSLRCFTKILSFWYLSIPQLLEWHKSKYFICNSIVYVPAKSYSLLTLTPHFKDNWTVPKYRSTSVYTSRHISHHTVQCESAFCQVLQQSTDQQ